MTKIDLRDFFTYDPDTGVVRHNPDRPAESFKTTRGYKQWVTRFSGKGAGFINKDGYLEASVIINGARIRVFNHRIALYLSGITIPDDMYVDHIDGNGLNNRLTNLRVVTKQDNARNQKTRSNNTSGTMGVYWSKSSKKWKVGIMVNGGKALHLGYYEDKDEAIKVRKEAEVKHGFHANHGRDNVT